MLSLFRSPECKNRAERFLRLNSGNVQKIAPLYFCTPEKDVSYILFVPLKQAFFHADPSRQIKNGKKAVCYLLLPRFPAAIY
jgi:hypothetical protein